MQTIADDLYDFLAGHEPKKVERRGADDFVTCACGWQGEVYLSHLAFVIDGELKARRYRVIDPRDLPFMS